MDPGGIGPEWGAGTGFGEYLCICAAQVIRVQCGGVIEIPLMDAAESERQGVLCGGIGHQVRGQSGD